MALRCERYRAALQKIAALDWHVGDSATGAANDMQRLADEALGARDS